MADNGHQEAQTGKTCPFLHSACSESQCALYTAFRRNVGGLQQQIGLCSFNAMAMILSEINLKTQNPQPPTIKLPGLVRNQ